MIIPAIGVLAVMAGVFLLSRVIKKLAESSQRKVKYMRRFYRHANAVYGVSDNEVPEIVSDALQRMAAVMRSKDHVTSVIQALMMAKGMRHDQILAASPTIKDVFAAFEALSDEQREHVSLAWLYSAMVSAETSILFAKNHTNLLEYALKYRSSNVSAVGIDRVVTKRERRDNDNDHHDGHAERELVPA